MPTYNNLEWNEPCFTGVPQIGNNVVVGEMPLNALITQDAAGNSTLRQLALGDVIGGERGYVNGSYLGVVTFYGQTLDGIDVWNYGAGANGPQWYVFYGMPLESPSYTGDNIWVAYYSPTYETPGSHTWEGIKRYGDTPIGTYERLSGSDTTPTLDVTT